MYPGAVQRRWSAASPRPTSTTSSDRRSTSQPAWENLQDPQEVGGRPRRAPARRGHGGPGPPVGRGLREGVSIQPAIRSRLPPGPRQATGPSGDARGKPASTLHDLRRDPDWLLRPLLHGGADPPTPALPDEEVPRPRRADG